MIIIYFLTIIHCFEPFTYQAINKFGIYSTAAIKTSEKVRVWLNCQKYITEENFCLVFMIIFHEFTPFLF